MGILLAIVVLGVLIFIHELGHFTVAKLAGVYVEKFSLGFGPKIFGFKIGETEYRLSLFPLGGYVKMYGENTDEKSEDGSEVISEPDPKLIGRSFTEKSRITRALIILAGPISNIVLAVVAFWAIFASGVPTYKAEIGVVAPGSPAELAGIKVNDIVTAIDDSKIESWEAFASYIAENPEKAVKISLASGSEVGLLIDKVKSVDSSGNSIEVGDIGVSLFIPPIVGKVFDGKPASKKLEIGDRFVSINNIPIASWYDATKMIRDNPESELAVVVDRGGKMETFAITPEASGEKEKVGLLGIAVMQGDVIVKYGTVESLKLGFEQSYFFGKTILQELGKLVTGRASVDNLGGPITIVKVGAESSDMGLRNLVAFMAAISLNLAVLNLLPIPVLDGGQLLILGIEGITRRKLNEKVVGTAQTVGFFFLISVMVLAFYLDISRFFTN